MPSDAPGAICIMTNTCSDGKRFIVLLYLARMTLNREVENRQKLAAHFGALTDPTRLKILMRLIEKEGEPNVTVLSREVQESLANVSHHLVILKAQGFVTDRRDGQHRVYSLDPYHADFIRETLTIGIAHIQERGLNHHD